MPAPNYSVAQSQRLDLPLILKPQDCKDKTFIVTGANSGIGYECAKHLVQLEAARVLITVRDLTKGEETRARIEAETRRSGAIGIYKLDLTAFDSVRAFVTRIVSEVERVDGVVANAGTSNGEWFENEGMEGNFTVNIFSNFLLMAMMQPYLKMVGDKFGVTPSFTFTGSMGPFVSPKSPLEGIDRDRILEDLNDRKKWESPDMGPRYTLSKLLLFVATRQLAQRAPVSKTGVAINVTEPGLCSTGLTKNLTWITRAITWVSLKLLGRTPEMGSRAVLAGLALGKDSHGSFVSDCEIRDDRMPEWLTNDDGQIWQQRIWEEVSTKMDEIESGCLKWASSE